MKNNKKAKKKSPQGSDVVEISKLFLRLFWDHAHVRGVKLSGLLVVCLCVFLCVRLCVRVWCVRACVRACVRTCVRACAHRAFLRNVCAACFSHTSRLRTHQGVEELEEHDV